MAASSSSQTQQGPLSSNPDPPSKPGKKISSRKGKGKENTSRLTQRAQGWTSTDKDGHNTEPDMPWDWAPLTDPSASRSPPIFTKDGSYFFSLVGSSVKIHSVSTGEVVSTLTTPEISDDGTSHLLTAAILNPHNPFQLITSSLDGRLTVWDFLDASLLKTIDIAQPIHYICAHENFRDSVFVAASRSGKKAGTNSDDNAVILRVSLKTAEDSTKSTEIHPIGKTRFPTGLTFSPSGAWLVATAGHKVYVAMSTSLTSGFTKYVSQERLTCLAFHPVEEYFATGDEKGNIRLWYCLGDNISVHARGVEKKTQTTTLHWHAHAVSSIAFTSNGAYLLSGGEESVLVVWQLHTGKKEFVPRVGAPINTVSLARIGGSEEEYLLGLADATYLFISAGTLKVSRSYARIRLDPAISPNMPSTSRHVFAPLAVHSLTSTIILPSSHPSSLQIYSPSSSKLVSELEVSPSNRISRREEKHIEPSRIERAAVSSSGDWLASIDTRSGDDGFRGEVYLKLWKWSHVVNNWVLNTRIDRPHGLKNVTSMTFKPLSPPNDSSTILLVTTGEDCNVKIWGLKAVKGQAGEPDEFWTTRSSFNFRSQLPRSASWSPDASLLAVSLEPYVAIYNPVTSSLRCTLATPECKSVSSAHFVGQGGRYLIVAGKHDLILWDLVTRSVRWHHKTLIMIDSLFAHQEDDSFALFSTYRPDHGRAKTRVSIFRVSSPLPSTLRSLPFALRNFSPDIQSCKHSGFAFIGITQDWSVVKFGDSAKVLRSAGTTARELATEQHPTRRTLFQDIFGKSAFAGPSLLSKPGEISNPLLHPAGNDISDIFGSPSYLMPPIEHLYKPLMSKFLRTFVDDSAQNVTEQEEPGFYMDEDAQDVVVVGKRQSRVVDQGEMDTLITLFRKHSVASHPMNGSSHDVTKIRLPIDVQLTSDSPSPALTAPNQGNAIKWKSSPMKHDSGASLPPPTMNGKKRKTTSN